MFLVDTNVWLEHLLDQERAGEVKSFLDQTPSHLLYMTDFTFHSIGIILTRLGKLEAFLLFVQDAFVDGAVSLVHLSPQNTKQIAEVMHQHNLDFDDAYQYVTAQIYQLTIVSFDSDFDRTPFGRRAPAEVLDRR